VFVRGDTKGAQEIGGFMSPSANKFCASTWSSAEINLKSSIDEFFCEIEETMTN
jgi:hypothetical protein